MYGEKNGTPKELWLERIRKWIKTPRAIPKKPAIYPKIIYINLNVFIANRNVLSGIVNAQIPEKATIIIKIGLTMLAEIAASPKIKAPYNTYSCTKRRWNSNTRFLN